jgi:hypothetical protein
MGRHPKTFTEPEILGMSKSCLQCLESGLRKPHPHLTGQRRSVLIDLWEDTGKVKRLMQMQMRATDILEQLANLLADLLVHERAQAGYPTFAMPYAA